MDFVILIAFLLAIGLVWMRVSEKFKGDGHGWFLRNLAGASAGTAIGFVQLILMIGESGFAAFIGWFVFGGVVWLGRQPLPDFAGKPARSISIPYKLSPVAEAIYQNSATKAAGPEPLEIKAIRRESLDAMARATKAREKEKKREAVIEDPLARWKETVSPRTYPRKANAPGTRVARGERLDVVNFKYINADGEFSARRIKVTMAGESKFEGIDLEIHAQRTFRYDRVVGAMTSETTGEMMPPDEWAASVRGESFSPAAAVDTDDNAAHIEICFTGFTKADKLRLEGTAYLSDMQVRQSVTKGLTHLCMGKTAGPKKIDQAVEVGAELIDEAEFYALHASS